MKAPLVISAFAAIAAVVSSEHATSAEHTKNNTNAILSPVKHGNLRELAGNCGGGKKGNGVCADSSLCCSKWGWCGSSAGHCAGQPAPPPPAPTPAAGGPAPSPTGGQGQGGTSYSGASPGKCANRFDPRGKNGVVRNQLATWHEEYIPGNRGGSITVNCDDMAKTTLGKWNDMVAAIYTGEYGGGARCGSCVLVEGPHASAVVTVVDKCECGGPGSHLDLSPKAFKTINNGDLTDGIIPITWKTVSCSVNEGKKLHYRFKQGSTKWWIQLAVFYNVDPIRKVEVKIGGRYYRMAMQDHGYWAFVESTPPLETPLKIRLISTAGQVVKDELQRIEYSQSVLVRGSKNAQFTPGCPA